MTADLDNICNSLTKNEAIVTSAKPCPWLRACGGQALRLRRYARNGKRLVQYMVEKNFHTIYDFVGKTLRVNRGKSCPAYF
jgi:hypothetical protein